MKRQILLTISCAAVTAATALLGSSCSSAMKRADVNDDGKISTTELNRVLVVAVFEAADKNGDGIVTYDEWKLVFPEVTKEKFQANGLGESGSFTLEDALAYCKKHKVFDKLVAQIDSNGDGIIDKQEAGDFQDEMKAAEGSNDVQKLKTLAN